jgi:hydroxypyruvate isomerase
MITVSVCLETVFTNLSVEERIARIAAAGYKSVEFWHPEGTWDGNSVRTDLAKNPVALRQACERYGVTLNDFAMHAWDGSIGGCPVKASDRECYLAQIRKMIAFAKAAGCTKGIILSGTVDPSLSRTKMRENLETAFAEAVKLADQADFTLLLEPLNTRVDHAGYYLDSSAEALDIVRSLNHPRLKILYDVYHMQIMEGNILATIERLLPWIGHFHAAGVPGRGELFGCELNYPAIVRKIESLGYQGAFGLEYFPKLANHDESLRKTLEYLAVEHVTSPKT